jgi:pimeloyl-ACP methyl ester carboxylesterase
MFALEYAARYPDSLRGLVLADSQVAPGLTPMQTVLQHGLIPLQMGIQRVLGPDRASAVTEWIARRVTEADGPEDDELAAYAEETDEMFAPGESLKVLGAVRRFERPDLASIDVPTLGVYGKEDPAMMHRNAVELGREVPRAELRLVPETGHGLTWERPAAFERTVREFLEKENVTPERA